MISADQLFADAFDLPYKERKEQLLRAADLAAAENDLDLEFRARMAVVTGSHNDPDKQATITNYGWCLARSAAGSSRAVSSSRLASYFLSWFVSVRKRNLSFAASPLSWLPLPGLCHEL